MIRILSNPDIKLGSTSVRMKQSCLYPLARYGKSTPKGVLVPSPLYLLTFLEGVCEVLVLARQDDGPPVLPKLTHLSSFLKQAQNFISDILVGIKIYNNF